jgi:short-chain Z-isoprenyl diphosphate synthase
MVRPGCVATIVGVLTVATGRGRRTVAVPEHLGIIVDGNRRWARARRLDIGRAYDRGAGKAIQVLGWCDDLGVRAVTLWVLSLANLARDGEQLRPLLDSIARGTQALAATRRWRIQATGCLDLLPPAVAQSLLAAQRSTAESVGMRVNLAVAYGGRHEIVAAARDLAATGRPITEAAITDRLADRGQHEPDLIVRTAGEQRLSGFLLWQAVHTELYFCRAPWPRLRRRHLVRALRAYGRRRRTYGG